MQLTHHVRIARHPRESGDLLPRALPPIFIFPKILKTVSRPGAKRYLVRPARAALLKTPCDKSGLFRRPRLGWCRGRRECARPSSRSQRAPAFSAHTPLRRAELDQFCWTALYLHSPRARISLDDISSIFPVSSVQHGASRSASAAARR